MTPEELQTLKGLLNNIESSSDKSLVPILQKLKDLRVISSWYYNGTYHGV